MIENGLSLALVSSLISGLAHPVPDGYLAMPGTWAARPAAFSTCCLPPRCQCGMGAGRRLRRIVGLVRSFLRDGGSGPGPPCPVAGHAGGAVATAEAPVSVADVTISPQRFPAAQAQRPPPPREGWSNCWPGAASLAILLAAAALGRASCRAMTTPTRRGYQLMPALALPVLGLVLVEQVFRNLAERRTLAGQAGGPGLAQRVHLRRLPVYAEAVLLGRLDPDASSIRPLVRSDPGALVFGAARRKADWSRSIQVSRRAVFYSAAAAGGGLPAVHGRHGLLRALLRWRLGPCAATGLAFASVVGCWCWCCRHR
jgi:hypothetical protein